MKNINVFCEFWRVINRLKYLGYDILARKIDSTNKCVIMCKHLVNSLIVDVTVDYIDEWYWNSITDKEERVQGFSYDMRVNNGFWHSMYDRQELFKHLTEVSKYNDYKIRI